jgi:AraC-like DNA-binding protein
LNTQTSHITPYDLACLGTIFIGISFALQLGFAKRVNRAANRFLALALVTIVLQMVWVVCINTRLTTDFPHWSWLPLHFSLATGPLIYLYVLKITRPGYKFPWKDLLHFSPLLLELGALVSEVMESIRTGAATYDTQRFQQLNPVLQLLAVISIIMYLNWSFRLIERFYQRLKFNGNDRYRYELRWLHRLLTGLGLLWLFWIAYTAVDYFYYHYPLGPYAYHPLYLALAVMMIWIAAVAFLRPEIGVPGREPLLSKPSPSGALRQKGIWLKKAMEASLFYEDSELSLTSLAEALDIHPHELSRIINVALKKNFNDFINEYRIREVTRKMQDPAYDRLTLQGIAFDVGFNSKSTFNRVFREMIGKSPAEYKNHLKKERPSYHLRPYSRSAAVISCHEAAPKWPSEKLNRGYMFRNYLKIGWRNLVRNKAYTLINIGGLSVGMACTILILLWVQDELSYDKFNKSASQIYRLTDDVAGTKAAVSPLPVGPALKQQLPAIKDFTRLVALHSIVTVGDRKFDERNIYYADPNFLQVFDYPLLRGRKATVLSRPNGIVITADISKKYFGDENAIGKTLYIDDDIKGHNYIVTGVMQNIPHNSHLQFDMLLPLTVYEHSSNYSYNNPQEWGNYIVYTYLLLKDGFDGPPGVIGSLERQITAIHTANDPTHTKTTFTLQPLADIHLHSNLLLDVAGQGSSQSVNIFSLVALFILLIACVNFTNLSTAIAGQRAKEVGLRKTVGALRPQLIIQFLGESLLLALVSLTIGISIARLLMPLFSDLSAKSISVNLFDLKIMGGLLAIAVLVGLISGSYPAFFLSSFKPVKVLKGIQVLDGKQSFLRNGLVVLQFSISVILMVSTLVVNNQLKFIRNRDMGFNKENLLYLQMPQIGDLLHNYDVLKATLGEHTRIADYTLVEYLPTDLTTGTTDVKWDGQDPNKQIIFPQFGADGNFIKTFGIHLVAGRSFDDNNKSDAANYILNETAVKTMGMSVSSAVGKQITVNGNKGEVIGVVKDFNFKPVQQLIEPLILSYTKQGGFVVIRTRPADMQQNIANLKAVFQKIYPCYPFSYGFVDQDLDRLYLSEQRMGKLFNIFSVVSIIVSCLGLFGLATFAAQKRIKEIGVRRVLGASATGIAALLAKDFVKLVAIALLVAFPLAWWVMGKWLDNYVYRIDISWWMFALAGFLALLVALFTVSSQAIKAALTKPAKSLRSE